MVYCSPACQHGPMQPTAEELLEAAERLAEGRVADWLRSEAARIQDDALAALITRTTGRPWNVAIVEARRVRGPGHSK